MLLLLVMVSVIMLFLRHSILVLLLLLLAVLLLLLMIPKFKKVHHEKSEFQFFFLQIYLHVKFKNELLRKKSPNLWLKSKLKNFKLVYYYFGLIHFSVKLKYHIIYVHNKNYHCCWGSGCWYVWP